MRFGWHPPHVSPFIAARSSTFLGDGKSENRVVVRSAIDSSSDSEAERLKGSRGAVRWRTLRGDRAMAGRLVAHTWHTRVANDDNQCHALTMNAQVKRPLRITARAIGKTSNPPVTGSNPVGGARRFRRSEAILPPSERL